MTDFKPKPYQKAVLDGLDNYRADQTQLLLTSRRGRMVAVGVDKGEPGGDHSVISRAYKNKQGKTKIFFDEYANWPMWKWYRNPIKWYRWYKVNKLLEKQYDRTRHNR